MEEDWSRIDEIEDDAPVTEAAARRVRNCAPTGCLICAIEEWDDE